MVAVSTRQKIYGQSALAVVWTLWISESEERANAQGYEELSGRRGRSRMRILLDCDGVLADFVGASIQYLRQYCGLKVFSEDVTNWDMAKALDLSLEHKEGLEKFWRSPSFHTSLKKCEGASAGVHDFIAKGYDVRIVTAPMYSAGWIDGRLNWLGQHYGILKKHVILASAEEKPFVRGDVFVDDRADTVAAWGGQNNGLPVLMRRPWSGERPGGSIVFPIQSWHGLKGVIGV